MTRNVNIGLILIILLALAACEKHEYDFPMNVEFVYEPVEAKTTDSIIFRIDIEDEINKKTDLFYRWDWNGDSIWDTEFTSLEELKYRFYSPGSYDVALQYSDGKGNINIIKTQLSVQQGFSAPKANFSISPAEGNFTQDFVFNGCLTHDDEDSLDLLLFRWDFQGDGFWDTGYDTNKIVSKKFSEAGFYKPKLEVKDPSGLVATVAKDLIVNRTDTLINVILEWEPTDIAVGDTVIFDVSKSFHSLDSNLDFRVSWFMPFNPVWTDPKYDKQYQYIFRGEGVNKIGCKLIMDYSSLENIRYVEIFAAKENKPPLPEYVLSIPYGNVHTQFYFDCWRTRDDNLPTSQIFLRWDWDNDGKWDTPFSLDKRFHHQYNEPGVYEFTLQAMDNYQVKEETYGQITVTPFENPTSYIIDHRDEEIYGTVQIGDQWWMAEDLRFEVPEKTASGWPTTICLMEREDYCESIGKLYHVTGVIKDRFDNKEDEVCPKGWRIPTKDDLTKLVDNIGGSNRAADLAQWGSTDFMAGYTGYCEFYSKGFPIPTDTIYEFKETWQTSYFVSSSIAPDINEARVDTYMLKITRGEPEIWMGYHPTRFYMPIRCIKED